jgi:hypothetical protein
MKRFYSAMIGAVATVTMALPALMKRFYSAMIGAVAAVTMALPASASSHWYDGVELDTASVLAIGGIVLTALGVLWAVRKGSSLIGR